MADRNVTRQRRRAARPTTYVFRVVVATYLFFLVAWPVSLVAKHTFDDGFSDLQAILDDPDVVHALRLTVFVAVIAVVINTSSAWASRCCSSATSSRASGAQRADRPAAVGVADRRRAVPGARLRRPRRLVRPRLEDAGFQVIFATPGDRHGHRLRRPAPRHPRGRAGPRGDRHRAGAGRPQPRRQRAADLPPHHAAVDQVGRRLRRRAQPRPLAGRVRRREGRVGQRARRDPHRHPGRRGEVPELRPAAAPTPRRSCSRWSSVACIVDRVDRRAPRRGSR